MGSGSGGLLRGRTRARGQELTENIISALIFLPIVGQFEFLRDRFFIQREVSAVLALIVNSGHVALVLLVSAISVLLTVTLYRRYFPSRAVMALGFCGAIQVFFLIVSAAGSIESYRIGLGGVTMTAAISACRFGKLAWGEDLTSTQVWLLIGGYLLATAVLLTSDPFCGGYF